MKGRIALTTGAAAVFLASLCLGLADVRAGGHDDEKKIEKKVVVRSGSGRLGVSIDDTTGDARGATVRSVAEDSAAEKAGIKEGDVIIRFDGEAVRSASHLSRLVAETPSGRAVAIEVSRGGATQKLTATLAEGGKRFRFYGPGGSDKEWTFEMPEWSLEPPDPPLPPAAPGAPHALIAPRPPKAFTWKGDGDVFSIQRFGPRKLGIEYMELGEQLAAYFKAGKSGVLVTSVDADGPAAKAGLKAGDVIVKLGADVIADGGDLREALSGAEGGSEVAVTVQREGRPVELKVTLARPEDRLKRREARGVRL